MKKVKLTSVCRPKQWKSIPISELSDVGYPVYGANGVIGYYDSYNHEQETVIITCRGATCGTVNLTHPRSYVTGNAMCLDNVKDSVDIKYLFYSMQAYDFTKVISGTAQPQITRVGLEKVEFALPSLDVQREIVSILDKIDTLIEKRRLQLKKLDDLIKARFIELFGDPMTDVSKWSASTIGEQFNVSSGGTPATGEKAYWENGTIPWIGSNMCQDTMLSENDGKFITEEGYAHSSAKWFHKGTVLVALVGATIGKTALLRFDTTTNQNIAAIDVTQNAAFSSEFVFYHMQMLYSKFMEIGSGKFKMANQGFIRQLPLICPPIELQEQFAAFIEQTDKSKHHSPRLPIPPLKWYPLPKNEVPIMEEKIIAITNEMAEVLNIAQLKKLQEVLVKAFSTEEPERKPTNHEYLRLFLEAKSIEGCSPRTLQYYEVTVQHLFAAVNLPVRKMTTERMREYLSDYQQRRNCSKATIDNIRRNISSFFSWLEEEDHILKSPMRRIHKIKTKKTVKEVISDEDIEKLRDSCTTLRDLAMIDLLYSTGIRVGELVRLNIEDVNFESRECVVFGKGDKERRVYFDAKTKIHLKNYLESRRDTNRALFVSLLAPYNRLAISGVEIRLRKMGRMLNLKSIHPHKFRRTMATRAIDKGMPIEQVQKILGHSQIDTTMQYAIVNQNNVKMSHQKYIA